MEYTYTLIIPHYNIPKLLRRLLGTVPHREDLQVIVVDDCSTKELDELEKVHKDYNWMEWYTTGTNGGGGKARNIGLKHTKGKYLLFADADDFFLPSFELILNEQADLDVDILYFSVISLDTDLYSVSNRGFHISNYISSLSYNEADKMRFHFTSPWAKLINKDLIITHNITFEESDIANDVRFSTLVDFHARKFAIDKRAAYCLTDRKDSVSKLLSTERAIERMKIDIRRILFLRNNGISIATPTEHLVFALNCIIKQGNISKRQEAYDLLRSVDISSLTIKRTNIKIKLLNIIKKHIKKIINLKIQ